MTFSTKNMDPRSRKKIRIHKRITGRGECPRIVVFRSSKHIYAQLVCDETKSTLASASTLEKEVRDRLAALQVESGTKSSKGRNAARVVGEVLAARAKSKQVKKAVFDRSGYVYSGRIAAVADGARQGGLEF